MVKELIRHVVCKRVFNLNNALVVWTWQTAAEALHHYFDIIKVNITKKSP